MTPLELQRQVKAGKSSYQGMIKRALDAHWPDLDMAARHLTGARRALAFHGRRGVTTEYMRKKAEELGYAP